MKKFSLGTTIAFAILLVFAVSMSVYLFSALSHAEEEVYANYSKKINNDLSHEESLLENIGIVNAIFLADRPAIKDALINNDREAAITELKKVVKLFKKSTKIKNMKIHIHTADVKAFVRNWKPGKFGDDLSGFRKTIMKVKKTHKPVFDFEVGRIGLTLRSIVPIMKDDKYLGSVEFIQDFTNVPKNFERKGNNHLLLMNASLLNIATYLKDAPVVGDYKLSTNAFNKEFLAAAQALDINRLKKEGFILTDTYFFTYKIIKDVEENDVGMHLLGMPAQEVLTAIDDAKTSVLTIALIAFISVMLLMVYLIVLKKK